MNNFAKAYVKKMELIARVCGILGAIGIIILVLLTVSDVFLRYFFNRPILGSFELTEYLLVPIIFFAIPWATMEKVNVRVDLIVGKIRSHTRAKIYAVSCVFSIFVTFVLAWFTVPQAIYMLDLGAESDMLKIPAYPFYFFVALGFFILFFALIANLIDYIEEAVAK